MKKLFTILTVVALSTTVSFSQNEAGTIALGTGDIANASWTGWGVSPVVGYFVSDGVMVGTGFEMESGDASSKTTKISPFLRYYLKNSLFAKAGVEMTMPDGGDTETDISLGLGLSLMWMERVAIEPGLGVTIKEDYMGIALNLGISFRLGMDD